MINKEIKGFIESTKVCLTSEKFKGFKYNKDSNKDFFGSFTDWAKIDLTHFKNIIDFLSKAGYDSFKLKIENNKLKVFNTLDNDFLSDFNFNISLINKDTEENIINGHYSIDYVYTFLKNFKKSEIKKEFINLYWTEDYPILLDIADLNKSCLIAPRIEVLK